MSVKRYKEFCETYNNLPLFMEPWWLDKVCGSKNWNVILSEKGGKIAGVFPYYIQKGKFTNIISLPKLTPRLGHLIVYPQNQNQKAKFSFEKKIINDMIKQFPKFNYLEIGLEYKIKNWLPYFWNDFKQTTNYSYVINNIKDHTQVFDMFSRDTKSQIKKSNDVVSVKTSSDIEIIYNLNKQTFNRQKKEPPFSLDFLKNLDAELSKHSRRKIYYAIDENENIHAAIYIVWDNNSAYYLIGGGHPEYRKSGASSLLIWDAIKFCSEFVDAFDFEGSMIEPIESYFRGFGAEQIPFHKISKSGSKLFALMMDVKKFLGK